MYICNTIVDTIQAAALLVVSLVTASGSISSSPRWLVFLTNQVELVLLLMIVRKTNPASLVFTIIRWI